MAYDEKIVDPDDTLSPLLDLPATFIAVLLKGWSVSMMWNWFVVPATGLAPISIPIALGLTFLIGYMTRTVDIDKLGPKPAAETVRRIKWAFVSPLLVVVVGWIVHLFV